MTTTPHEDQFRPEPDLESECRQARVNTLDVCVWDKNGFKVTVRVSCKNELYPYDDDLFKFCPFCGKKIEVKK